MQAENRANYPKSYNVKSQNKILIVEKNLVDAAIVQSFLKSLRYQNTAITTNAKEAVKMLSVSRFDMVIIGAGLLDVDEINLCAQIRSLRPNEYIPIIACIDFEQKIDLQNFDKVFDDLIFMLPGFYAGFNDFQQIIQRCALLSNDNS